MDWFSASANSTPTRGTWLTCCARAFSGQSVGPATLVDILPVCGLQQPGQADEDAQHNQHPEPDLFAQHLVGLKRPGRIINVTSVLGFRTIGRVPAYCAAKAGLTHLTHVLAMELARHGILVNALAPGYVETDFNRAFFQTEPGKALISRIPLKRLGQTEDLDGALLFLASPASAYVTGAVIAVDGGHVVAAI